MIRKRDYFILIALVVLGGCSFGGDSSNEMKQEVVNDKEIEEVVEPYVDTNPIKLGLYLNENGVREMVDIFWSSFPLYQDIGSFEVYYTTEESLISGSQKEIWSNYYQNYTDISEYKIGYHISFTTSDGEVDSNILKPSDGETFFDYVQVYLYDDIHAPDGVYSHVTTEEMTDETLFTSIKLTGSTKIGEVTSDIRLKVFTYLDSDIGDDGDYKGNSYYEIAIKRA